MKRFDLGFDSNIAQAQGRVDYATGEEWFARKHNSVVPYFRLSDSLCKKFLELATDPQEFEGLKLLFPFVREMALLRFPRTQNKLAIWMRLAFMAGHDLGRAHPDRLEDVLPGLELREAARRVGVVRQCSGEERLTFEGLRRACAAIVKAQWSEVPECFETTLLEVVVKSLRTGYAAGTVAQGDPSLCDSVCDMPASIGAGITDIVCRALVGAAVTSVGKPVVELLEHPLLRLAREYYPGRKVESDSALAFFRNQLGTRGVKSENECPSSELDLADWVTAGLRYGHHLKKRHPEQVQAIFREADNGTPEITFSLVRRVVSDAGGTEPIALLGSLKRWQERDFGWVEPECYGEELARVVYFADFAFWISWASCTNT